MAYTQTIKDDFDNSMGGKSTVNITTEEFALKIDKEKENNSAREKDVNKEEAKQEHFGYYGSASSLTNN